MNNHLGKKYKIGKFFNALIETRRTTDKDETFTFLRVEGKHDVIISFAELNELKKLSGSVNVVCLYDNKAYKSSYEVVNFLNEKTKPLNLSESLQLLVDEKVLKDNTPDPDEKNK